MLRFMIFFKNLNIYKFSKTQINVLTLWILFSTYKHKTLIGEAVIMFSNPSCLNFQTCGQ